ncbi:MAG: glycosyltransferase family 2 protein [Chloroflexi bacterium]|nr:glycosyltransferase family 2 protein [Chloroflexota bacterium]
MDGTMPDGTATPDLSVVIVNYNAGPLLRRCLEALTEEARGISVEILLVDNASVDGSPETVAAFPGVRLIRNRVNVGYAAANNQGIRLCRGRYILLLNPDAIVDSGALAAILGFMVSHPEAGICGPRVVLPDGRLDAPCRRSFKTAGTYLYKALGLCRLFPRSRVFGRYYLTYLDDGVTHEVDAVLGAFLLIRREVVDRVGLLDERFFLYCEDEDWCYRAKQAGWKIYYYPAARVLHYKGACRATRRYRPTYEWHKALFCFHRKHLAVRYPTLVNAIVYLGMAVSLAASLALCAARAATRTMLGRPRHPALVGTR